MKTILLSSCLLKVDTVQYLAPKMLAPLWHERFIAEAFETVKSRRHDGLQCKLSYFSV